MRPSISEVGTGLEKLSYSLQYVQERLHRRTGMICTSIGERGAVKALVSILTSLTLRFADWVIRLTRLNAIAHSRTVKSTSCTDFRTRQYSYYLRPACFSEASPKTS